MYCGVPSRDARARETVPARLLERESDAEVGHQRVTALQQNVLGLHVAVYDTAAVRMLERIGHLAHQPQRDVHGKATLALEPRAQRLALDEGHDVPQQPDVRASSPRVEQREDVRVLQRRRDTDLLEEPLRADGRRELLAQHLDRDAAVVLHVACEVHGGHAAAAELALDLVAAFERLRESLGERRLRVGWLECFGGRSLEEVVAGAVVRGEQ